MENNIPFNEPLVIGTEERYIKDAIARKEFSGQGYYTRSCEKKLEGYTKASKVLLTSSCTHALEMSALLLDIQHGDEIIMSSFNFVSAANAFVLRGAKIIFVDIRPDTLNIDEKLIEAAITPKTKAILVMHYGGVPCEMDYIMQLADRYQLKVIEDAAHCIGSFYNGRHLGTIGHLGTLSFHATKNIQCGEGGALLINDHSYTERAEIIREKGTNRQNFIQGKVDKYTWVDIGSSYLMSELTAAFLYGQLLEIDSVTRKRLEIWKTYKEGIKHEKTAIETGNGHIFYIICKSLNDRNLLVEKLNNVNISAYFHYLPLHKSHEGKRSSIFNGKDNYTTYISECVLRLPLYNTLKQINQDRIIDQFKLNENS
ncbi:dTDP-4-amino-4,6-dideoxygalactose transaminase [Portibacter lacus]|uniref:dTDP-4-amino-4,6-dideoxygalactose transaminase n=1 Tax=Portibacter lacus TaxID=1099794 RepID=A0AA37SSQ2_9BACT|nr:dTDP-4-amino-4,6-dideoxygalactose transaminase [Portibacter lacus]GLR19014.1 dTDP-4-amino-4,6-dideoxygalactose transaminase [Portibacter lacus]